MPRFPGFVGPSYQSQSPIADRQRCMNLYLEQMEVPTAKSAATLYPTPGFSAFATVPESPGRGIFYVPHAGRLFAVMGQTLYELDADGGTTSRGTLARDLHPATLTTNGDGGNELFITSGGTGYILDLATNALTEVVSDVTMGEMLSGFFLALDVDTSTLKISDALKGTTWDGTQIAQRSTAPDPWRSLIVHQNEIWLFGEETTEVWYNAGESPFPFLPRAGAFLQAGTAAASSPARFDGSLAWLGRSRTGNSRVYRSQGYSPVRISTHAIEDAIQGYADAGAVEDAVGWAYSRLGHEFYVLTFPSANATWVYDAATNLWHERGKWNANQGRYDAYRAQWVAQAFGKHLVCDCVTGAVYSLNEDVYTDVAGDGGNELRRERVSPHVSHENRRLAYQRFELELQRGIGLTAGQGHDPQVMMQYSDNGGQTWSRESWRSAGKLGEYGTRVDWRRLGMGRDRVFRIVMTDPVPWRILDAYLEVSPTSG